MSWTVKSNGKAKTVAKDIAMQFTAFKDNPLANQAADLIAKSLAQFSPDKIVTVTADGNDQKDASGIVNVLNISIHPEWT